MDKLEGLQQILDPPSRPSQSATVIENINQAVDLKPNSSSSSRSKVFISYSHKDARYLKQLQTHLAYYERVGLIEVWDDTKLSPGAIWQEEIKNALRQTKVAILLVSAAFLASKFIVENELPPLLAAAQSEGAVILSVILSACAFEDTELAQFQAVNSPSMPVAKMRGYQRDAFWATVVRDIRKTVIPQQFQNTTISNQEVVSDILEGTDAEATGKQNFNGKGSDTRIVNLKSGVAVFRLKYEGTDIPNFNLNNEDDRVVSRLNATSFSVLTVSKTGIQKAVKIKTDGVYLLKVHATGSWEVEIEQ